MQKPFQTPAQGATASSINLSSSKRSPDSSTTIVIGFNFDGSVCRADDQPGNTIYTKFIRARTTSSPQYLFKRHYLLTHESKDHCVTDWVQPAHTSAYSTSTLMLSSRPMSCGLLRQDAVTNLSRSCRTHRITFPSISC